MRAQSLKIQKIISGIILSLIFSIPIEANENTRVLSYDEIGKNVSERNFTVLEDSLKVYQAKKSISVARANLLPKLNLWRLIGIAFDPKSAIGVVEDIAPFLVPSNWFRVEESKILYESVKEGFKALWSNELHTAKNLFVQVYYDGLTVESLNYNVTKLLELEQIIRSKELMGAVAVGSTSIIRLKRIALESDLQDLKNLYKQELKSLTFAAGLNAETNVTLSPLNRPGNNLQYIDYNDFWPIVQKESPELRQFDKLISIVPLIRKEVFFSFLGASSTSLGVGGGVFDNLPIQDGLGFGASGSVRIISKQEEILKLQRQGIEETLKRNLFFVVDIENSFVTNYNLLIERKNISQNLWRSQIARMIMGEEIDFALLLESLDQELSANLILFQNESRYLINLDRLDRLTQKGDYLKVPTSLDDLQRSGKRIK